MKRVVFLFVAMLATLAASGQRVEVSELRLEHNVSTPEGPMLKMCFRMSAHNLLGHKIIPKLFIDRAPGVSHYWANGGQMVQDGVRYEPNYVDCYWNDVQWIGIYNKALNPLPGTQTYNARVLVWDETAGRYVTDNSKVPWVSFTNTGVAQANNAGVSTSMQYVYGQRMVDKTTINIPGVNTVVPYTNTTTTVNKNTGGNSKIKSCRSCGGSGRCVFCGGGGKSSHTGGDCPTCRGSGWCIYCHGH